MKLNRCANRVTTPFGDFQIDVDNLFDQVFGHRDNTEKPPVQWTPRVTILESETSYQLLAELPGVDPTKVNLEMVDNRLEISGTKTLAPATDGFNQLREERQSGDFRRTFEFAQQVDANQIQAKFHNGILEIELAKAEAVLPKKIAINVVES